MILKLCYIHPTPYTASSLYINTQEATERLAIYTASQQCEREWRKEKRIERKYKHLHQQMNIHLLSQLEEKWGGGGGGEDERMMKMCGKVIRELQSSTLPLHHMAKRTKFSYTYTHEHTHTHTISERGSDFSTAFPCFIQLSQTCKPQF
jgi:ABC-type nickel/cobalt efflux system permease component RcnA